MIAAVVPFFENKILLQITIDSLLSQFNQNIFIVLIDDGSLDDSFNLAKEYFLENENIIIFKGQKYGINACFNLALAFLQKSFTLNGENWAILDPKLNLDFANSYTKNINFQDKEFSAYYHSEALELDSKIEYVMFVPSGDYVSLNYVNNFQNLAQLASPQIATSAIAIFNSDKIINVNKFEFENIVDGVAVLEKINDYKLMPYAVFNLDFIGNSRLNERSIIIDYVFFMKLFLRAYRVGYIEDSIYSKEYTKCVQASFYGDFDQLKNDGRYCIEYSKFVMIKDLQSCLNSEHRKDVVSFIEAIINSNIEIVGNLFYYPNLLHLTRKELKIILTRYRFKMPIMQRIACFCPRIYSKIKFLRKFFKN